MSLILRKASWGFLAAIILTQVGCGAKRATVTGRVTLSGRLVDSGSVTFFPEDNAGTTVMGDIVQGEYKIEDIVPGKKRVYVSIADSEELAQANVTTTRSEANRERIAGMKKRRAGSKPTGFSIEGNNKVVDIVPGEQKVDIPLEKSGPGK